MEHLDNILKNTDDSMLVLLGENSERSFTKLASVVQKRRLELGYTEKQVSSLALVQLSSFIELERGTFQCLQIKTVQRVLKCLKHLTVKRQKEAACTEQKELSKVLIAFRTEHSISRAEFAEYAGVSRICLSYFEMTATKSNPTLLRKATIDKIMLAHKTLEELHQPMLDPSKTIAYVAPEECDACG